MKRTGTPSGIESQSLHERLSAWRELVERCGRKPSRKRVHALRVVTLRIQAEVEHERSDLPHASHEAQSMLHFGKLADKLRDALGAVRELDVWIGKLQKLSVSLNQDAEYVPRSTRATIRQIERLEARLGKKRERAGAKLVAEIEKRHDDLLEAAQNLEEAATARSGEVDQNEASALLKQFAEVAAEFPVLDEDNLHDFRKGIKKIRYVAENCAADPMCGHIAALMRKAQAAIGEWHDWQILARTAERPRHAKHNDVVELLNSLTAEAYEAAIAECQRVMHRMVDLDQERGLGIEKARKAPVRSEGMMDAFARKLA
jgi:CHAD domain-containing protein